MKKLYFLLGALPLLYSCSEIEKLPDITPLLPEVTTRLAGDEKYDVLGFGYDVTGEYLHPMSVKNPVLDIEKYEKDNKGRLIYGTSSFGFDRMYYGYSSSDYTKDVTTDTKATLNMNYGSEKDTAFFSGNISDNSYLKTEYSYSDKYSFASLDIVRNRKYIRFNDEVSNLSQYLSTEFKEDLKRLTPNRIVERYGTHVLTDFIIGGRYKLMFRSVITNTKDTSTKRQIVHSGFKITLGKIGLGYNLDQDETVYESLAKENRSKELYVLFYGGNGTNLKYDLEKGIPTSVDTQSWENSVSLENSCLTAITWKETYPIYAFISDPVKKAEIQQAVHNYIKNAKLKVTRLKLLYSYEYDNGAKHLVTTNDGIAESFPSWKLICHEGYILEEQILGTVPLYEYYNDRKMDFYITTDPNYNISNSSYKKEQIMGYVYNQASESTVPFYEYYHAKHVDHLTSYNPYITQNFSGWTRLGITGYIYPND